MSGLSQFELIELNILEKALGRKVTRGELRDHMSRKAAAERERYEQAVRAQKANLPLHYARVMDLVQAVAIERCVWRGTPDELARLVAKDASEAFQSQVVQTLRVPAFQALLFNEREVALWKGSDHLFRLVDQQPATTANGARSALHHFPSGDTCRYCLMRENHPDFELVPERDFQGDTVPGSRLHPMCQRAWKRLRSIVNWTET